MNKTGYVCSIAYDEELGTTSVVVYPSIETLKNAGRCTSSGCGIVELEFKEYDPNDNWPIEGYMEWVCYHHEAGIAPKGAGFYPNEDVCRDSEPYTKRYGVVRVQARKLEDVQLEDEEKMIEHSVSGEELNKWKNDKNYHPLNRKGEPAEGLGGPEKWDKYFNNR